MCNRVRRGRSQVGFLYRFKALNSDSSRDAHVAASVSQKNPSQIVIRHVLKRWLPLELTLSPQDITAHVHTVPARLSLVAFASRLFVL
jgi:hypothetical protein